MFCVLSREPVCLFCHRAETPLTENYVVQVSSMHPTLSQDAVKDDVVNNCTANILTTLNDLFSAVNSMMLVLSNESQPPSFHFQDNMHKAILI